MAPSYAPKNKALIEVTIIGNPDQDDKQLESTVRAQLTEWFGPGVNGWRYLRTYRIPHALPMQIPPISDPTSRSHQIRPGLFVCGEYNNVASIQWAMVSGRQAAESIMDWLGK